MEKEDKITALTVRLYNDGEREAVRIAMRETGCRQASRALVRLCVAFGRLVEQSKRQSRELKRLQEENARLRGCMALIRKAQNESGWKPDKDTDT